MEKSCKSFFFSWPEAFQAGVEAVGGKGWNLGRLERYGFKIPPGGVLTSRAYQDFIEVNNLREATEDISQSVSISNIGEKEIEEKLFLIREKIKAARISSHIQEELISKLKNTGLLDKPLAVRSSATAEDASGASFAGIHESYLNVSGQDNLLSAIKECYASLWTPRAVAYRRKMGVKDNEVLQAVVLMELVEAAAAGVAFTCDPRTGREDMVLISANFGLGESLVSGAVDPDEYLFDYNFKLADKKIGRKEGMTVPGKNGGTEFIKEGKPSGQVLPDDNIQELGMLVLRVFEALGNAEQHQDIEWAFDGEDFFLVQSRPVTALPVYSFPELKGQQEFWSNANFRDAVPMVQSTLNWSTMKGGLNLTLKIPLMLYDYRLPAGLQLIKLFQGRAYLNLSKYQWAFYDALGLMPGKINEMLGGHQPEIVIKEKKPYAGVKGLKRLMRILRAILVSSKIAKRAEDSFNRFEGFVNALLAKDFTAFSEKEFIDLSYEIRETNAVFYSTFMVLAGRESQTRAMLVNKLEKNFKSEGAALANALMAGGGEITSAQHGYRLVELAEIVRNDTKALEFFSSEPFKPLLWEKELPEESPFKKSFRDYLKKYGHRGVYELDIINPRWREDPSYLLNVIRSAIATSDLPKLKESQREKADRAWQEINRKVSLFRRKYIRYLLKQALRGAEFREMAKSVIVKMMEPGRVLSQEIGRRLAERGIIEEQSDIYHCAWVEIASILNGYWDGRGLKTLVADRKERRKEMEALLPPDLIIGDMPKFAEPQTYMPGRPLAGMGVSAGKASGPARLIMHPDEGEKLLAGDVLVAPSTDPGWTPLFLRASAIVMETGGFSSHGAIVAREYGIPAVVNIPGVMKMIKNSQLITVDGDQGKIYL